MVKFPPWKKKAAEDNYNFFFSLSLSDFVTGVLAVVTVREIARGHGDEQDDRFPQKQKKNDDIAPSRERERERGEREREREAINPWIKVILPLPGQ